MKITLQNIIGVVCIIILNAHLLTAGTTGKISGVVKSSSTGEALVGSTIIIEGTTLGSVANVNGQYYIINIYPGTYSIRASMIGYKPLRVTNVVVSADLTTQINISLEPTTVLLGEQVVTA